jgi:hypothetical protein
MTDQDGGREQAADIARAAKAAAASAVEQITRQAGGDPGARTATGLQAARRLELAARMETHRLIQAARAGGMGWHEIGAVLGLGPDAAEDGLSVAEAAFNFATGRRIEDTWDVATFWWQCPACGQTISDRGPGHGHPADDETGHAGGCTLLAATVAAWDTGWTQEG